MEYPFTYDEGRIEEAAKEIDCMARTIPVVEPENIGKYAACKFCGQFVNVEGIPFSSIEEIIEYATEHCSCSESKSYIEAKRRKEREKQMRQYALIEAHGAIEEQFGDEAEIPVPDETRAMLFELSTMVYDGKIKGITLSVNSKTKAVITKNQKGKLLIDRKESDTSRIEIG